MTIKSFPVMKIKLIYSNRYVLCTHMCKAFIISFLSAIYSRLFVYHFHQQVSAEPTDSINTEKPTMDGTLEPQRKHPLHPHLSQVNSCCTCCPPSPSLEHSFIILSTKDIAEVNSWSYKSDDVNIKFTLLPFDFIGLYLTEIENAL